MTETMFEVICPHCQGIVIIEQLNCKIFRHGIFKRSGKQIPPHAPKAECDVWVEKGEIWALEWWKTLSGY